MPMLAMRCPVAWGQHQRIYDQTSEMSPSKWVRLSLSSTTEGGLCKLLLPGRPYSSLLPDAPDFSELMMEAIILANLVETTVLPLGGQADVRKELCQQYCRRVLGSGSGRLIIQPVQQQPIHFNRVGGDLFHLFVRLSWLKIAPEQLIVLKHI